jgi:serine/threonine protein kinase
MNKSPIPLHLNETLPASVKEEDIGLQDTMASSQVPQKTPTPVVVSTGVPAVNATRLTALPRISMEGEIPKLTLENKERYQSVKLLGRGGVGEVNLVQDQDIVRAIAMKKLLPGRSSPETMYRFAQEVRTVGQLEHPNIIPIHDVGRDEAGDLYFTMKYVDGETLETIIEKLKAGDPDYHRKFTYDARTDLFISILNAVSFAHAKGIIHRDIKPANIMVGPYGEVVVMDWGIAKQLSKDALPDLITSTDVLPDTAGGMELFKTQQGAIVGTPAYMSPEQAKAQNNTLDARSDIYSLCVLFYELLTLQHYLQDKKNVRQMLMGVLKEEPTVAYMVEHPSQSLVPAELAHFLKKGMEKDPDKRFQSVKEMITKLQENRSGAMTIQCSSTFMKRMGYSFIHWVDRHPFGNMALLFFMTVALLTGGVSLVWR